GASGSTLPAGALLGGRGGDGGSGGTGSGGGGGGGGEGGYGASLTGTATVTSGQTVTGGIGGNAGSGTGGPYDGGGGGSGGNGLSATGSVIITNNGTITGGNGGIGGNGSPGGALGYTSFAGRGGDAGHGATLIGGTLENTGTITGGNGGLGGTGLIGSGGAAGRGDVGSGGFGVAGINATIINSGTISGGFTFDPTGTEQFRSRAIVFAGGTNRLELRAGSVINGIVDASGDSTLALGGSTNSSFDVGQIEAGRIVGFQRYEKTGNSTWTLTGTTTEVTPWTVNGGRLVIASDGSLGDESGTLTLASVLRTTTAPITTARAIVTTSVSAGIETDADLILTGSLSGTGAITKSGAATLTMTGSSTYDGVVIVIAGTLAVSDGGQLTVTRPVSMMGSSTLVVPGSSAVLQTSSLVLGHGGTPTVRIIDGGRVTVQGLLDLWANVSTVSVSGQNAILAFNDLHTSAPQATLSVSAGGRVISNGAVTLGFNGSGTITVTGAGSVWDHVSATGMIIGDAGSGTLTVADGGLVSVANGTGTLTVASRLSGSGALNIGAAAGTTPVAPGTIQAATVQFGAVPIGNGTGAITFNHTGTDYTFAPAISGKGAINVLAGVTILTPDSSAFTGTTTVSGGTLRVDGKLGGTVNVTTNGTLGGIGTLTGPVAIGAGGTLSAGASPGTLTVGTLTLSPGSTSRFELNSPGVVGGATNDLVVVTGNLTLGGALDAQVAAGGYYRLFNYGGTLAGAFDTTTVTGTGGFTPARQQVETAIPNQVNLAVVGAGQTLQFWDGADSTGNGSVDGGTGTWTNTGTNWTGQPGQAGINGTWGGSVGVFAGTAGAVAVSGTQAFDTLQFSTTGYTLTGGTLTLAPATGTTGTINVEANVVATIGSVIADGTGTNLNKIGAGTLILNGVNTYSGGTTIAAGTLQIGDGVTPGSIIGNIVNDGVLAFTNNANDTFAGVISGGGSVQVNGDLVILAGANTYTGGTTINGGTLSIAADNNLGSVSGALTIGVGTLLITAPFTTARAVAMAGGTIQSDADLTLTGTISGTGGVTKTGAGTLTVTGTNSYSGTTQIAAGTMAVANGGSLASGSVVVSGATGSNATLRVDGPNSTWQAPEITVGRSGTGTVTVTNGGRVVTTILGAGDSGTSGNGTGSVTVSGTGSTVTAGDVLTYGGPGSFTVSNGGRIVSSGTAAAGNNPGGQGTFVVTGAGSV
ncbi:autotransporter-associated beta strand repeat-containing protein, partial [Reyranella sp. CPCC 100927]|uniref:beta strand repeat-containing protein n=1 Tax=Reyranella sp. CPCC 100927 TaxID=2599616 RepID=UPI0011B8B4C7